MDGFPDKCLVPGVIQRWERLVLRPITAPVIRNRKKDSNIGEHIALLQQRGEPGPVISEMMKIGPPGVPFIDKSAVSYPAGKRRIRRRIVKAVKNGLRHTG